MVTLGALSCFWGTFGSSGGRRMKNGVKEWRKDLIECKNESKIIRHEDWKRGEEMGTDVNM